MVGCCRFLCLEVWNHVVNFFFFLFLFLLSLFRKCFIWEFQGELSSGIAAVQYNHNRFLFNTTAAILIQFSYRTITAMHKSSYNSHTHTITAIFIHFLIQYNNSNSHAIQPTVTPISNQISKVSPNLQGCGMTWWCCNLTKFVQFLFCFGVIRCKTCIKVKVEIWEEKWDKQLEDSRLCAVLLQRPYKKTSIGKFWERIVYTYMPRTWTIGAHVASPQTQFQLSHWQ